MAIIKINNNAIDLDAAEIPNLDAAKITTGQFADAKIADVASSKITGTITPSDATVTTAKIADGAVTAAKLASGVGGISEADMFRLTSGITANVDPIANNLERVDNATFAKIGTGMSLSSGVFSFAATGLYSVEVHMQGQPTTNDNVTIEIYGTANNGTAWDALAAATFGADTNAVASASTNCFFNCTNVSTHKIKFAAESITAGSSIAGRTTDNVTAFQFIRLGDSQ